MGPLRVERPCSENWTNLRADAIGMKKSECRVQQRGWGSPGCVDGMRAEGLESSPSERDLGVLVGGSWNLNQQKGQLYPEEVCQAQHC